MRNINYDQFLIIGHEILKFDYGCPSETDNIDVLSKVYGHLIEGTLPGPFNQRIVEELVDKILLRMPGYTSSKIKRNLPEWW